MPYLLDGNNLIGRARRTGRPSEADVASLIAEVSDRLRRTRASAVLFLDGAGGRGASLGRLSVRYAGSRSADDAILAAIQRSGASRDVVVVTGDRGLAERAREAGARSLSPEAFWSRFGKAGAEESPAEPARVNVEEWIQYFEDDKNRS
jgi:hypothetical protein